ncbi:MAG: hypothetical protein ABIH63_03440 [archaeon]
MQKKGQLTIFIIIGIVILFVLAVVYFTVYAPKRPEIPPEQFSDVQKYVDSCVEQTLRDGVTRLGRGPNPDYEGALADYVKSYLVYCPNFTADFPELVVKPKDIVSVNTTLTSDKSMVSAVVIYPISISKGAYTKNLERFYAEYSLVERGCASVPVNVNCRYTGSSTVTVKVTGITFTFNPGDFVGIGGVCIACKIG